MLHLVASPESSGWFTEHKDAISGLASIAAVLGLFATAFALIRNFQESRRNTDEAKRQRELAQAQAIYEIQRDGRQEAAVVFADSAAAQALLGHPVDPVNSAVGRALNYYSSVYQMWRLGVLDERLFEPFNGELRILLTNRAAQTILEEAKDILDPGFVDHALQLQSGRSADREQLDGARPEEGR